jgi:hypothetical protein
VSTGSGIQIGKLVQLQLENGRTMSPRGWIVGCKGRTGLLLGRPVRRVQARLPAGVVRMHRQFHGANPAGSMVCEYGTSTKGMKCVGRLKAIMYRAQGVRSPAKRGANWNHAFGDTGHEGLTNHPRSRMPELWSDGTRLVIKRMRGNTYYVGPYDDGVGYIIG